MHLIDGKLIQQAEIDALSKRFKALSFRVCLAVILVGNNPGSLIYIKNKRMFAEKIGVDFKLCSLPEDASEEAVIQMIGQLNADVAVHGILVQMPLPKPLSALRVIAAIDPKKDVDGLHPVNQGKLVQGDQTGFVPCTPLGVMKLLSTLDLSLKGLHAVVVGRSILVGRPMALCLLNAGCTVTVCHSETTDIASETRRADLVIVAAGHPGLVTGEMLKKGAIVIDVGITRGQDGKIKGDVDFDSALAVAGVMTPVPGGVGPMTIWGIGHNLYKAALL